MKETQILRGLHAARTKMATPTVAASNYYAKGSPFVRGKKGKDKVPAMLTHGEAVLPVATVKKVGAGNIARLIADTNNGKAPSQGLRAGGHYYGGSVSPYDVEGMVGPTEPTAEAAKFQAAQAAQNIISKPATSNVVNPQGLTPGYQSTSPATEQPNIARRALSSVKNMFSGNAGGTPLTNPANMEAGAAAAARNADVIAGRAPKIPGAPTSFTDNTLMKLGGAAKAAGSGLDRVGAAAKFLGPLEAIGKAAYVQTDPNMKWTDTLAQLGLGGAQVGAQTLGMIGGGAAGALASVPTAGAIAPVSIPAGGLAGAVGARMATDAAYDAIHPEGSPFQRSFMARTGGNYDPNAADPAGKADWHARNDGLNAARLAEKYPVTALTPEQITAQKADAQKYGTGEQVGEAASGIRENSNLRTLAPGDRYAANVAMTDRMAKAAAAERAQKAALAQGPMATMYDKNGKPYKEYNNASIKAFTDAGGEIGAGQGHASPRAIEEGRKFTAGLQQFRGMTDWASPDSYVDGGENKGVSRITMNAPAGQPGLNAARSTGLPAGADGRFFAQPNGTPSASSAAPAGLQAANSPSVHELFQQSDQAAIARNAARKTIDTTNMSHADLQMAKQNAINNGDLTQAMMLNKPIADAQAQKLADMARAIPKAQFNATQRAANLVQAHAKIGDRFAEYTDGKDGKKRIENGPLEVKARAQIDRTLANVGSKYGVPHLHAGDISAKQLDQLMAIQDANSLDEKHDSSLIGMLDKWFSNDGPPDTNRDLSQVRSIKEGKGTITDATGYTRSATSRLGGSKFLPNMFSPGQDAGQRQLQAESLAALQKGAQEAVKPKR